MNSGKKLMENRVERSDGVEIPKKKRSLDLKSLYKSSDFKVDNDDHKKKNSNKLLKRNFSSVGGDSESEKKKKISSTSNYENGGKKGCKSLDELYSGGLSSNTGDLNKVLFEPSQNLGNSSSNSVGLGQAFNGVLLSLDDNGIYIPKRRRGLVQRKKFDVDNSKLVGPSMEKDAGFQTHDNVLYDSSNQVGCSTRVDSGHQNEASKVKRKKFDGDQVPNPACPSSNKDETVDDLGNVSADSRLLVDFLPQVESLKGKNKKDSGDLKVNKSSRHNGSIEGQNLKVQDTASVVNNGLSFSSKPRKKHIKSNEQSADDQSISKEAETSLNGLGEPIPGQNHKLQDSVSIVHDSVSSPRKPKRNRRKRTKLSASNQSDLKEAETSLDVFDVLREDDEDNLEQNAARMLSSRFDPSCTGFSSDNKTFPSLVAKSLSLSGRDFDCLQASHMACLETASVDAAGRFLRTRKQRKKKGLSRKRRHFYEILPQGLDGYWVLNRRIKVFWPLDKSWYHGLINDYDPLKKLHHVKYDDRDEEWINLQNERFKLLLLPSDVSGNSEVKKLVPSDRNTEKEKSVLASGDDSDLDSHMDSEPIISWLARSTRRVLSSTFGALKKQTRLSQTVETLPPVLSERNVNAHSCIVTGFSKRVETKSNDSQSPVGFDDAVEKMYALENPPLSPDVKQPIVYSRRRSHQKSQECSHMSDNNHACISIPETHIIAERCHVSLEQSDQSWPLWCLDNSTSLKLCLPAIESRQLSFVLSVPVVSVLRYSFAAVNSWLFHTLMMFRNGMLITAWPAVHLEMLFVDDTVGLSFFLFEGCLKQAIALVFLVQAVFHQQTEPGKYFDLQMPVTSVRIRFSSTQNLTKQLVFSVYNFSKVESSKWLALDSKLKKYCLFTEKLPLSDCTHDNIKVLQSGFNHLHLPSVQREYSLTEMMPTRFGMGTILTDASKESACAKKIRSSYKIKEASGEPPAFSLSFTAAPTLFLGLHLKLLMDRSVSRISFPDQDSVNVVDESLECSDKGPVIIPGNSSTTSLMDTYCSRRYSCVNSSVGDNGFTECNDADLRKPSHMFENGNQTIVEPDQLAPRQHICSDSSSPERIGFVEHSDLKSITVEIPPSNPVEYHVDMGTPGAPRFNNFDWHINDGVVRSSNPTGPRTMGNRNRNSDGKTKLYHNGHVSGPKKPRTHVSYTLPTVDFDSNSNIRSQHWQGITHKRIRIASDRPTSDRSKISQRNPELLSCDANVLITLGDKGWRESQATIVVELIDRTEWRLVVKLSGSTKYSYKAHQFLQPGSTNRYSHAMMWRGGKEWILEFPDRSQWTVFKEMHEECYNRNVRAASVKNIPIPGVHLLEESDDNGTEVGFVRSYPKYFRQVENDVDMALDPARIVYDMDSDDEQWILKNQISSDNNESELGGISDELFEKMMDMFEKVAYTQQHDQLSFEEMEEFLNPVGPVDVTKIIYDYWWQKRQRKGMALIRQLQPPLWERYQKQVKEWELAMSKTNGALSNGCHAKTVMIEKPPMVAFCLKPRGFDVPHKGSKQRSHRRLSVSGHINNISADHEAYHPYGRRINGFAGEEKVSYPGYIHELHETSPSFNTSSRAYASRDVGTTGYFSLSSNEVERNHLSRFNRTKSKKLRTILSNDLQQVHSLNKTIGNRNVAQCWNMGLLPEWPSQKNFQSFGNLQRPDIEHLDNSVLDEFRLRDASGAARHALNMSKLKREKAERLLHRADLAIHKAAVAVMTAEAIKKVSLEDDSDDD